MITSPCSCLTFASLTAAFFCTVFLLVLRLVSVVVLWFALPTVGYALILPAVGFAPLPAVGVALLPAVGFALLGSSHHRSRSPWSFSGFLHHHYSALRPS